MPEESALRPQTIQVAARLAFVLKRVLKGIIFVVLAAIWAVIGLVICVPLTVRSATLFLIAVARSTFSNRDLEKVSRGLDYALWAYFLVFAKLGRWLFKEYRPEDDAVPDTLLVSRQWPLTSVSLWALLFWLLTIVALLEATDTAHPIQDVYHRVFAQSAAEQSYPIKGSNPSRDIIDTDGIRGSGSAVMPDDPPDAKQELDKKQ